MGGCIFFTRLLFDGSIKAFLLSPVAVDTGHQGKGIGQKLINFGIKRLGELGVELIFTYGDPRYYAKVGFRPVPQAVAEAPFELAHPEDWLGQSLAGGPVQSPLGKARCVEPFNDPQYW